MSTGCQHQRRVFRVPIAGEDQDPEAMRAICKDAGHIPSGPAKRRVCSRCGQRILPPSLEDVSRLMNASTTPTE